MSPSGMDQRGGSLRDGRVKNWFWCDNALFEMGLSKHALVVYLYLCRVAGDSNSCWPSLKKISLATKCSRSVVINAIKELKAAGLVETKPSFEDHGDQGSNIYTMFNPRGGSAVGDHLVRRANGGSLVGDHGGIAGNHEEERLEEELPKKKRPLTLPHQAFEVFWEAYPKKVAKEKARTAWMKHIGSDSLTTTVVMEAVRAQQAPGNTLNPQNGKTYIPHPASWLNGKRWNDEIVEAPKVGRESISGKWEHQAEGAVAL